MDLYPKQPELDKPGILAGACLSAIQLFAGILATVVVTLIEKVVHSSGGNSTPAIVATLCGALSYATWAERKIPHSLSKKSMRLWLSAYSGVFATILSLVWVGLVAVVETQSDVPIEGLPPAKFLIGIVPIGGLVSFFLTYAGLSQGRRVMERQRLRSRPNITPSE